MKPVISNPMSDYASATYALRLYCAPRKEFPSIIRDGGSRGIVGSIASQFSRIGILCETAVTPMQVNNISMHTQTNGRGMTPTKISFDIVEPRNSTFVEQMVAAQSSLGWESVMSAPMILEIRFLGRKHNNSLENDIVTITLPIVITKNDITLDNSSSTYHIAARLYGSGITEDYIGQAIPETMTVDAGNNMSDFFNNYAQMLNAKEQQQVDNSVLSMPKYIHSFDLPEEYKNIEISKPASGTQTSTNKTFEEYNASTNRVTFTNRTAVPSAIDIILNTSSEIQEDLLDVDGDIVYTHRIFPDVTITEYDYVAESYQHEVVWRIRRIPVTTDIGARPSSQDIKRHMAEHLDVLKIYEYYFTGENTEVRAINWLSNNIYKAKTSAYSALITRNSNNRTNTGQHNQEPIDVDIEQESIENARDDVWSVKAESNELGETVFYTSDIDIDSIDYTQPQPRTIVNNPDSDNGSTDIDTNRRSAEYMNQLSHIRNLGSTSAGNTAYVQMELKIKGDPFWILPPSPNTPQGATPENTGALMREPKLLLQFYHPNERFYSGENFSSVKQYSAFTGIYIVTGVTTTFNNGRFEQSLTTRRSSMLPSEVEELIQQAKDESNGQ